ncbi:Acetyl-CoA hydrolase/transferase C-terminal domain-containing protein [Bosea sp. CRIB-10]|uniref:acetyl-CoA hydrolase/transferase C-terminal domain-containing protein n=1 Tax=Bosea sp. CRIB-10 TaxID=378404 RepID=UPI0008E352F2|nr:acetyl-CoA hydrolase/transferase C-terminal domain-containing protein [Bosea sp. CRIB-10]SFD12835.1 Acetyl-CoA hydrolase/transferase C-terminal domain-containing protein [Bosea sp. CRIB-10]
MIRGAATASQVTRVVTEFGVAAVAGLSGTALALAPTEIAAPEFRVSLRRGIA